MKLLILGGTVFVGRHLVEAALERGHTVTMFNRGRRGADLFPGVERLTGDRDGGLSVLEGRRWDAVVDTSGYLPRIVRASAELLAGAVDRYAFVSSISVYEDFGKPGTDESSPVGRLEDETVEEVTGETYGPLKALCEVAVEAALPGRTLVVRPGLVAGPHDPTDRFTYWPRRVARGGEVLAPGRPESPVQFVDARDLAAFTLDALERGTTGVYNVVGPAEPLGFGTLLEACRRVSGSDARFTWVDEGFLLESGVGPWMELPLWIPEAQVVQAVSAARAIAAGLAFRPLEETVRDTLAWDAARPAGEPPKAGLAPEREAAVLEAWHAR